MKNRIAAFMQKPVAELSPTEKALAAQNIQQAGIILSLKSELFRYRMANESMACAIAGIGKGSFGNQN